jgi:hypothetical protein
MKCDDFLPALETGGFARRMRARRHAAGCPQCAAARAAFARAKRQLATAEPLSPRVRQLWAAAAPGVTLRHSRRKVWIPVTAGLALAACVLLLVVEWAVWKERITPQPEREVARSLPQPTNREVVEEVDWADGLSRLAASVDQLDVQLQKLRREAERLEARQQVALTLDRFARW